jgi:CRP-like cAMP-binding protein
VPDATLLSRVGLFASLNAADAADLANHLRRRRYARGEAVFLRGDPGTSLYIVESGCIKLGFTSPDDREIVFDLLGPGDVFGELALLDGEQRSADAVAVDTTELLLLQRDEYLRFLSDRPSVALDLIGILSRRLRRDAEVIQDAIFLDVPARLARTLLRLSGAVSTATPGEGPPVTPKLTQRNLAGMVGTTRETLNKWLGIFEERALIRRVAGRVAILDPAGLRRRIY